MKKYLEILVFLIIFSLGFSFCYWLFPRTIIKEIPKEKIVVVKGESSTQTIIQYVPKEDGENTDVEVNIPKPEINVKVNDKEYVFVSNFNEQNIFDNGKLVLNQSSQFDLNIKLPEAERIFELGGYIGTNSFGGTAVIPRKDSGSHIIMIGSEYNLKQWDARYSITW
jgi:hypothetical protein